MDKVRKVELQRQLRKELVEGGGPGFLSLWNNPPLVGWGGVGWWVVGSGAEPMGVPWREAWVCVSWKALSAPQGSCATLRKTRGSENVNKKEASWTVW